MEAVPGTLRSALKVGALENHRGPDFIARILWAQNF